MSLFFCELTVAGLIIIGFMIKKLKLSQILLCAFSGVAALLACDLVFSFFGMNMPLNVFTILISSVGGIPGVILLTLINLLII